MRLTPRAYKSPIAISLYFVLCLTVMLGPPNYDQNSGFACLIDKHKRLDKLDSPKVILVGGSNVALGMDSSALEKIVARPVVNMAFGCTVGLRYMLEEVKDSIKPGDLILVMPEYDFFCTTTNIESNARVNGSCELLNLVQVFPGSAKWILKNYGASPELIFDLLNDEHQLIMSKVHFYERVLSKLADPNCPKDSKTLFAVAPNIYNDRSVYNSYGDVTVHLNRPSPGLNGMEVINYANYKFNSTGAKILNDFGKFASARGAKVAVLPPPLPERVYYKWRARADDIYTHWCSIPNVLTLSDPTNFIFPEKYFFDTAYHLTAEGRAERTRRVGAELQLHNLCSKHVPTLTTMSF